MNFHYNLPAACPVAELDQPTSSSVIKAGSVQRAASVTTQQLTKGLKLRTNSGGYLSPARNSTTNASTYIEMVDYEVGLLNYR